MKGSTHGKWRCSKPGEGQGVIVLQLEQASQITGIDIGNNGSAFVEVLVTRSGGSEDYQVQMILAEFL